MQHIAEGRLGDARLKVDLYVWIDAKTRRIQGYVFNEAREAQVETLCVLLGLDKTKIEH
jgi:hypothetical protein